MKIQSLSILLATLVGGLLSACQSDTVNSTTGPAPKDSTATSTTTTKTKAGADLVGKWSDHEFEGKDEYWDTVDIRADGSFQTKSVYKLVGPPPEAGSDLHSGTWSVTGSLVTMKVGSQTFQATYRIEGNLLIEDFVDESVPDTMFRVP